ncbi:uncharacterized protein LOC123524806 [Mercenaria mercenaria]|uniref:uncharacterized protein LOC123524806 n=1 Tax=Mercenaria mercenaria TaxID=6596 RepID=UPI00234ED3D8|nr:uncharacterized protein LOC123524806 [Mercenaria mercenaria]XP_045159226.2 uncharacterized protein LOC123524806 [Mercenaria mercenaria]
MAGDGKPLKRVKLNDDYGGIYLSFTQNELRKLKLALSLIDHKLSGYGVGISKITVCDALCSKSFSAATCDCEVFCKPCIKNDGSVSVPEGYNLSGIFQYGFDMLESYIASQEYIPQRKGVRLALAKLLMFLSDKGSTEKALSHVPVDVTLAEWTVIVAHHLLSKLTIGSHYVLDRVCKGKCKDMMCTCGCRERLTGQCGDTTLGVPSYWYRRTDIMMDVPVTTLATEESETPVGEGHSSPTEMKPSQSLPASKEHIRAETIIHSFLQKKYHPELDNFLIPTIAMSRTHVAVCMYDCENDVFLETPLLNLFQGKFLKEATVVTLWLALNFKYCCSGVPDEIMDTAFKADFFKQVGPVLENYFSDVTAPCDYRPKHEWLVVPKFGKVKGKVDNVNQIYRPPK